jgi:Flp pilus assembly protein TadD
METGLAQAIRLHRSGDLAAAERLYLAAPRNADAVCNLGLIAKARGDLAEAERLFLAALSLAPENKIAAYNLGSFY